MKDSLKKNIFFLLAFSMSGVVILSIKQIDLIFYRIAIASGVAFLIAQLLDIKIFDRLKNRIWFIPPLVSSLISSTIDTFLFFSLAFFGSGVTWVTLAFGDLSVKFFITILMLVPFRIILILFKRNSILKKI